MKKRNFFIALGMLLSISFTSLSTMTRDKKSNEVAYAIETAETNFDKDPIHSSTTIQNYYSSISEGETGSTLLNDLHSLNSKKRTKTVGYKNMGKYYKQTDGDPNNPNNIIVFYSGESVAFSGSFGGNVNREHVWPNSRGGSSVEGDIHMPRPTLKNENGSRGNSFYVEGKKTDNSGWDPAMESFGKEKYRGMSARIIFYCAIADTSLTLIDREYDSSANKTMGKLSDLLKWNLQYEIDATETRRNDAAQSIQGNRNPFIDDRSLPCKIWGDTNAATKAVCAGQYDGRPTPTSVEIQLSNKTLNVGETEQATAKVLPVEANQKVSWKSSDLTVATISSTGLITALKEGTTTITATSVEKATIMTSITLQVQKKSFLELTSLTIKGTPTKNKYQAGDFFNGTGLEIEGKLKDGTTTTISPSDLMWMSEKTYSNILSEEDTSVLGIYDGKLTCKYDGIEVSSTTTNNIIKVERFGKLYTTQFETGQPFDPSGIRMRVYEKDGFFYDIASNNLKWNIETISKDIAYAIGTHEGYSIYVEIKTGKNNSSSNSCSKSSTNALFSMSLLVFILSIFVKKKFE